MTYRQDFTVPAELMEQVQEQGLDILPELMRIVINAAMQAEHYQHTPEKIGRTNGFYPQALEKGRRHKQ